MPDKNKRDDGYRVIQIIGHLFSRKDMVHSITEDLTSKGNLTIVGSRPQLYNVNPKIQKMYEHMRETEFGIADAVYVIGETDGRIDSIAQDDVCAAYKHGLNVCYHYLPEPYTVMLCGNPEFRVVFDEVARRLVLDRKIVLMPDIFNFIDHGLDLSLIDRMIFDKVQQQKVLMANEVMFINPGGQMNEDTRRILDYCKFRDKKITYYEDPNAIQKPADMERTAAEEGGESHAET